MAKDTHVEHTTNEDVLDIFAVLDQFSDNVDASSSGYLNFTKDMPHMVIEDDGDQQISFSDSVILPPGIISNNITIDDSPPTLIVPDNPNGDEVNLNGSFKLDGSLEIVKDGIRLGGMLYLSDDDHMLYSFGEDGTPIGVALEPGFDSKGNIVEVSLVPQSYDRVVDLKKRIAKLEEENSRLKSYDRFDILDIEEDDGL